MQAATVLDHLHHATGDGAAFFKLPKVLFLTMQGVETRDVQAVTGRSCQESCSSCETDRSPTHMLQPTSLLDAVLEEVLLVLHTFADYVRQDSIKV